MKVLLVGDNPYGTSGCSHMMAAILNQINKSKYEVAIFSGTLVPSVTNVFEKRFNFPIIQGIPDKTKDDYAVEDLLNTLQNQSFDIVVFVGIDLWKYAFHFKNINSIKKVKKFKWVSIFPYDLHDVRKDWIEWIKFFDLSAVYSKYGFELLKPFIPNIQYFRPPLFDRDKYHILPEEERLKIRRKMFTHLKDDAFLFGFIGPNQFRKDPQRLIQAFSEVRKEFDNTYLYLHTDLASGVFNLGQFVSDVLGDNLGSILAKKQNYIYAIEMMVNIYNSFDCLINVSLQEGLSLTIIESYLCGTPVLASNNTAHLELLEDVGGLLDCNTLSYLPVITGNGTSFVKSKSCDFNSLVSMMKRVITDKSFREDLIFKGNVMVNNWLDNCSDINVLLNSLDKIDVVSHKKKEILFVQHSSAGDVLMSTQCFKGLKERHHNLPFNFMTQRQYMDIVEGNPYVDKIIEWDEKEIEQYKFVYNPHSDKILLGGWNNLDTRLHDMYPYFTKVKADDMFIEQVKPNIELPDQYIVIQTSGGQKEYRTYEHMDIVLKSLKLPTVHLGSLTDKSSNANFDLRGKLSWRESAWVMKHAKAAIVIDSFLSHLAGALNTLVVVLFGPAPARVVGPKSDPNITIFLEPNKLDVCPILANCWGQPGKQPCKSPCINSISPFAVVESVEKLLGEN